MRVFYFSAFLHFFFLNCFSQAPFWTENFGTGCSKGTYANGLNASGNGTWTVAQTGTNDQYANKWFISAAEAGMGIGNCGSDCSGVNGTNRTLHVGWDVSPLNLLDDGSIYSAGNGFSDSDIRAQSPVINCTGQTNISLSFAYLLAGIPNSDYAEVHYSANGGGTWTTIATPPPTPTALCSPQGQWTGYTVALPASANNNNNVKIGFRWKNIDNTGKDPSIAIDDVKLTAVTSSFSPSFTLASPQCAGNTVTVTANTGTYVANGYTWTSSPSSQINSPNASVTAITFTNSGTYTVTLTASSGGTTASTSNTVLINPGPSLTTAATPSAICLGGAGQNATITVSGANSYTWMPGNLSGTAIVVSPTATTVYSVTGVNGFSCTGTVTRTLIVNASPNLTLTASSPSICSGSSITLAGTGAQTYTWTPGNLNGSTVSVSPTITTTYSVTGTSSLGCTGSSAISVTVVTCTGLKEMAAHENSYSILPNPASDKIIIKGPSQKEKLFIIIYDELGKEVIKAETGVDAGHSINIQALPAGVYLLKVTNSTQSRLLRFMKE